MAEKGENALRYMGIDFLKNKRVEKINARKLTIIEIQSITSSILFKVSEFW